MVFEVNIAILLQSLLVICIGVYFVYKKIKTQLFLQQKHIKSLERDVQAILICARGVGDKLHHQEDEFRYIQERQEKIELNRNTQNDPPYKQIMSLIQKDTNKHDMMDNCDLTQGEVELMMSLKHRANRLQQSH